MSFEYLATRWMSNLQFEPLWVEPTTLTALLTSPRFCLVAALTDPLERSAVRAGQVPVITDGQRTIIDLQTCNAIAAELRRVERR